VKVFVETYGCTMNQGEGEMLAERLRSMGHEVVSTAADADLVVLNTCTVIKETENRMVKRMSELSGQRKKLIVVGCMASVQPDDVVKSAPQALIMAPRDYSEFDSLVEENFGRGDAPPTPIQPSSVTAVLPISQGCVGNCSYCITKQARGTLTSYPVEDLVSAARASLKGGAREILVTAQDTACYGFDRRTDLSHLLNALTSLDGDFMLRVGMMNPDNLSQIVDAFIPSWTSPKVYQFLHLPVQSGSDAVLEAMNRGYVSEQFVDLVARLRQASPSMTLATDVITGFPGESADDHRKTVELLQRVRPDIVNVTRFSPRQGTPAAKAKNQIAGWVSKERSRELTKVRFEISGAINAAMVGRKERIMITEAGKNATSIGRTASYKPVVVPGAMTMGKVLEVEITDSAPTHLFGRLIA
jgi:MiaB-like tRNA modifying enzyme